MIECYFRWCPCHSKDEPFCNSWINKCTASPKDIRIYSWLRSAELKMRGRKTDGV